MKRILPKAGTSAFTRCVKTYESGTEEEVRRLAKELGFASLGSFRSAMTARNIKRGQTSLDPTAKVEQDVALQNQRSEEGYWKRMYNEAIKQIGLTATVENVLREIASVVPPVVVSATLPREQKPKKGFGHETDLLQLSDLHAGEVVSSEETMGMGGYDMEILNKRLYLLFHKTTELVDIRRGTLYIPDLVIAEQGDMLSGEIHDELVRTNVGHMMTIAVRTAFLISQGIASISPHFEKIEVVCTVGNHPRLYHKPHFKQKYINWDYLCYQWQAMFCRSLPNVTFVIPKAPFIIYQVENTNCLMLHGDTIRSWMGVPYYGIERAALRLREMFQAADQSYDALLMGHFHNRADIDKAPGPIIVNGSLKGGDEFSIGSLQTTNKPSQNLIYFHEKNGYLGGGPIYLAKAAESEGKFKDFVPDIWADLAGEIQDASKRK